MKALSLWQPWASAIALGYKRIETRHWSTKYRGPLAIHAAKQWQLDERLFASGMARHLDNPRLNTRLPFGAIVAVAELVDVKRSEDLFEQVRGSIEEEFGNYSDGRFGFILEKIRPLAEPIPFKGAQGLFVVPDELILASEGGQR